MAYRADIEIAVKGAQELRRLQDQVRATSKLVDGLNNYLENIGGGGVVRSIDNLNKAVADTAGAFNKAALGTDEATLAARNFVAANRQLTQGLEERLTLLKSVTEQERRQRLSTAGIRETTQYGGAIGPGPASPVGSLVGQKSPVEERIRRTLQARQDESELQQALLRLEQKSVAEANKKLESQEALIRGKREVLALSEREAARQKFLAGASGTAAQGPLAGPGAMGFPVALSLSKVEQQGLATAAKKQEILQRMATTRKELVGLAGNLQRLDQNSAVAIADANRNQIKLNAAKERELQISKQGTLLAGKFSPIGGAADIPGSPAFLAAQRQRRSAARGRIGGAVSGAAIGGAFPLLFGQGAGAAAGGAIGGLAGGLLGPGGSFAGSLLGTLLGDIASKGQKVKELATDIGFTAEQTKRLQQAFALAGSESDKFIESVQNIRGLSLSLDDQADAVLLVSKLTEDYGGKIDKVTNAFTSALESGKVTQATLNQLTSQGIPIQDALAKKYDVNRDKLLQMAKDGEISVQQLIDVLVDMGNKGVTETGRTESGFDKLKKSVDSLGSALAALGGSLVGIFQGPFNFILESLALITKTAAESINIISDLLKFSNPTKLETTAAIQAGRMPRGGKQSVIDVIGQDRLSQLEKQAGPGFLGLGTNVPKVLELLKQQPEFKVTKPKIGEIAAPSQLPPSSGGGGGKSAADKADEDAAREAARVAEIVRARQLSTLELQRQAVFSEKIAIAEMATDSVLVRQLQGQQELMRLGISVAAELEKEKNSMAQLSIAREFQAKKALAVLDTELDIAKIKEQQTEQYNTIIADLELELKLKRATTEQERERLRLEAERAKLEERLKGLPQPQIDQITQLQAQVAAPLTDAQNIEQRIGKLKDEVAELTNIGNIAINVADGIGTAFGQAFQGLISGSMTAKEALGSFFKSIGDMFVEMAAQIIAKQMTMIILQTILKALGAVAGGGGGGGNSATALGSNPNVAAYSGTGIGDIGIGTFGMRAMGGPVTSQQPYIVGERGPELFVPGTGGSVVNNNDLRSAMGAAPGSGGGAPVLNMSFQSTSINGVEYVSRDQLEQAMAQTRRQAARDGAQRGMSMTLDKLQQSPSTRSRVGIR